MLNKRVGILFKMKISLFTLINTLEQISIMNLNQFPVELLLMILLLVDGRYVFVLPRVCRRWRAICREMVVHQDMRGEFYPNFEKFENMLGNFRDIRSINFSGCKYNLGNDCLIQVVKTYPSLQSLNLIGCREVTDVGITKIGEGCPQLQSLNLCECEEVTDVGITKIGEGCPQLQSLDLSGCSEVTDLVYRTSERNVHNCNRSV